MRSSDPFKLLNRLFIPNVARVQCPGRLEQQNMDLLIGNRAMLHALGHDEELSLL